LEGKTFSRKKTLQRINYAISERIRDVILKKTPRYDGNQAQATQNCTGSKKKFYPTLNISGDKVTSNFAVNRKRITSKRPNISQTKDISFIYDKCAKNVAKLGRITPRNSHVT